MRQGSGRRRRRDRLLVLARKVTKAVFAGADLMMGLWPGPRLLIYHTITESPTREMDLPASVFVSQLDWLQTHGEMVTLGEALTSAAGDKPQFVLTFDDGYLSFYESAFPLLHERGIPFVLYLTTRPVETQEPLAPGHPPLKWENVTEMAQSGLMTIGSHTHSHLDLRGLGRSQIAEELATSDELIREHTGIVSRHFAYPKGYWDATAEDLIRQRYATAVLGAGVPIHPDTDRYRLHRIPIQRSDDMLFFKRKMLRGMRLEETARKLVKGYQAPPR